MAKSMTPAGNKCTITTSARQALTIAARSKYCFLSCRICLQAANRTILKAVITFSIVLNHGCSGKAQYAVSPRQPPAIAIIRLMVEKIRIIIVLLVT